MPRQLVVFVAVVLLLAGCGEQRAPVARRVVEEPAHETAAPSSSPGGFHGSPARQQSAEATGPEVKLGSMKLTAPEGWVRNPPLMEFIRAEFSLPPADDDTPDGRLTVTVAGGNIQENIDRWKQQFAGKIEPESEEKLQVSGREVALVDFSGTYIDQRGGGEHPGYRMLGAIVDIDGQLHFIKAYGPAKTMAAHDAEFRAFVQSLKPTAAADR
jgi:hypothetical protein